MRVSAAVLLLLAAVLGAGQARAEVKAVKLCGREFLRAVVYTCGGSRWRRVLAETDLDGFIAMDQSSSESLGSSSSSSMGSEVTRRDMDNMVTTFCCQVGCRKSDLNFLC